MAESFFTTLTLTFQAGASMNTGSPRVVGAGLFALDVIVRPDGQEPVHTLGGSAGNVLHILAALGWKSVPVGALGDDPAARAVHEEFRKVNADLRFLRCSDTKHTPLIYQHQLGVGATSTHRFSFACPDCGEARRPIWDKDADLALLHAELPRSNVYFFDRPTRLGVELAERYLQAGALVVFEPSSIGQDEFLFRRAIECAHIVKYSDERLDDLERFHLRPDAIEIQTLGSRGLRYRIDSLKPEWVHVPAFRLPYVLDTAGAGDWCTAGMIFSLFRLAGEAQGLSVLENALVFGQALSSLNCLTEGARGLQKAWSRDKIVAIADDITRQWAVERRRLSRGSPYTWEVGLSTAADALYKHAPEYARSSFRRLHRCMTL